MDESHTNNEMDELVNRFSTFLTSHTLWPFNDNEATLLNKLQGLVSNIKWSPTDAANLFESLLKRFESKTNDRTDLLLWMLKMLHHIEINFITPSWKCKAGKTLIELVQDEKVTDENFKELLDDDTEKTLHEILDEIRQQKLNQIDEKLLADVRDIVSSVCKALTAHNNGSQLRGLKQDLLKLCQAAEKTHFRPRVTQMVSWCIMALSETGRLIQVGTGEGKSCIVAMFAAYQAMRGKKVDIMSSSSVLAERDMEEWKKFYDILKISVGCNVNKPPEYLKKCYEHDVVYGTPYHFAGDWLQHRFERMDIFGKRTFQCAIVDEVDSSMLDKGLDMVYIGSDMPALQHLNPLLAFIWATVNQYKKIDTETTVGRKNTFSHTVLENLTKNKDTDVLTILQLAEDTGLLAKGSVKDLRENPNLLTEKTRSITAHQLAKILETIERFFPSCQVSLHCMNNDSVMEELNKEPQKDMAEEESLPLLLIKYRKIGTETTVGRKYPFHHVVLENITKGQHIDEFIILQLAEDAGLLAKGSVKDLRKNLSLLTEKTESITAHQLAKFFKIVETRFPSCQFALHCMNNESEIEELNKEPQKEMAEGQKVPLLLTSGGFCQYMYSDEESAQRAAEAEIRNALHFTPCELNKDNCSCYVPGFLSDLVESKLKVWIKNAFYAQTMTRDHEYVLEKHGVVPVDYSCTGVIENFRVMTDGLQQFLEMKHMFKLSDMTAITNYMSNVSVFQKYGSQIFGISGTLGQQAETETLQKIYEGVKTCQIPSFKRKKLFEVEGVIVDDEKEWTEKICDVVTAQTNSTPYRTQRAVLVVCETIKRAKVLHLTLENKVQKSLYISNNMDNTAIFADNLESGDVIIATNLAGRGTDLKVSEPVKRAGGLFVVQTFLPKNARVEAQAFGRTARQGSPGSAQLIVCFSHLPKSLQSLVLGVKFQSFFKNIRDVNPLHQDVFLTLFRKYQKSQSDVQSKDMSLTLSYLLTDNSNSEIKTVKKIRDDSVADSLASYLEQDIPKIKKKEELFNQYLDVLDEVHTSSNNKPAEADLAALNEFWGMWLLTNFNEDDSIMDLKNKLKDDLKTASQKLSQRESPSSNLHHYTAFGNDLRKKGHLAESIKMYTKSIQEDHCWAAIAYYNRAFASLTQQGRHQDRNCINQALEDLQNALKSVELYCEQIEVTQRYSKQQVEDLGDDWVTRFDFHMIARYNVLSFFKANINEAIKKVDRARDSGGNVKVEESLVYFLAPAKHLLPVLVLSTQSMSLVRTRDPLKIHQLTCHPSFDIFNELRCLESLGLTHVYTLDTLFSLGGFISKINRRLRQALD